MIKKLIQRWQARRAAVKFTNMILNAYWPSCYDLDGASVQDWGIKSGVMVSVPGGFDPDKHADQDEYGAEPGDPWYAPHPGLS